ncbi:MAG: malate synthase G, partial [Exilibacterium sp.]
MTTRIQKGGLQIALSLYNLVNDEILSGTDVEADQFWSQLETILDDLTSRNQALLAKRDEFQEKIDAWHSEHPAHQGPQGLQIDAVAYEA